MSRFSDYVTSVGFRLELSKSQLRCFASYVLQTENRFVLPGGDHQSLESLIRKGLLAYDGQAITLTREGELLAPLLRRAGLLDADIIRHSKLPTKADLEEQMK
jgi:hypothetical protein